MYNVQVFWTRGHRLSVCKGSRSSPPAFQWWGLPTTRPPSSGAASPQNSRTSGSKIKSLVNPQPCIGCRCLWNRCSNDQQQGGRSKARRPVQVPDVPFGLFCTFCTFWYLCRLDTPAGLMVFSRYAPEGKRSWGPTRALAGDITPEQANAYVKVVVEGGGLDVKL